MGHHHRVSYVMPAMELMSKFHTCFQENRQEFYRLSPVGDETPATFNFNNFLLCGQTARQNFPCCEPWAAVFVQSWKMHIKRDPSMCTPVHILPSCLLSSGFKKTKKLWNNETKGQSNSANNLLHSLCRADHRLSSLLPSPLLYLLISLIYILPSEQSSSTGDQFKYCKFPVQCSSELAQIVKH